MIADVLPSMWETQPEAPRERLQDLRELSRGAMAEMRTLLLELRPSALVDAELEQLLQQLADATLGRYRIHVHINLTGQLNDLPLDWRIVIYQVVQEAINNAGKHAEASQVTLDIHIRDQSLNLTVQDDGNGFDQTVIKGGHFGLGNMHERAETIDATLEIESLLEHGTTVWLRR